MATGIYSRHHVETPIHHQDQRFILDFWANDHTGLIGAAWMLLSSSTSASQET